MNSDSKDDTRGVAEAMEDTFDQNVWSADGAGGSKFEVLRRSRSGNVVFSFVPPGESMPAFGFEVPRDVMGDLLDFITPRQS